MSPLRFAIDESMVLQQHTVKGGGQIVDFKLFELDWLILQHLDWRMVVHNVDTQK